MTTILAGYLLLVAAVVAIVILRDHERGRVDLLSVRNVGLAGFVLFQLTSAAYSLYADNHGPYLLDSREKSGLVFAAMATVFLVVSMWAYRRGWFVTSLADRAPTVRTVPTDAVLLAMAIVVTLLAAGLRLGVRLPLIVNVAQPLGTGMAAVAAGLVGWVWGRNLLNPVYAAYSMVIVSADMMISLSGAFGRRGIVAVGAALVWGMYYSAWRYLPTRMLLYRLALVTLPAVIFVALYTSVRSSAEHGRSAGEHLTEMRAEGNVVAGIMAMASGQFAGAVSMWLIDNYPEDFEYRHLMTLRYLAVYAVPRRWWESKPLPLSNHIAQQAQLARVDRSRLKIGPGIVGTAAAEGGWYAVVIYAILFGLYLRLLDELVLLNVHSPFIVLAMGSSMGHILGLSRGSVAAFTFMSLVTVVGATLFMLTLGRIVEYTSIGSTLPSLPDEDEADPDSEPAPYQEYEQEHDGHRRRFVE